MPKVNWELLDSGDFESGWGTIYLFTALDLCSCGSEEPARVMREVLEWCERDIDDRATEGWEAGCYRSTAHELAAKILDAFGLLDHGTGAGWPWITDEGRRMLRKMREIDLHGQQRNPDAWMRQSTILEAIAAEPELPGDMPDEMFLALRSADRTELTEALRIVVRETKKGIQDRVTRVLLQEVE